jgi:hypothetical protein
MAMNAGVLEGDAQRFESNGFARMQEAINISGNEMNTCYTAEPMAALNAVEEESLLIGEAHATDNLNRRLQEHINSDTSGLDNFVVDFDSQAGGATESRVGLSADLHRAQTMRNEAIENLNKHDFANALLAAEDSTLLYQSARDEINCPNMQINIRSAQ